MRTTSFMAAPCLGILLAVTPAPAQLTPTFEDEVIDLVNQERWANGQLPPLKGNSLLGSSSETHSANMAERDFFAHCDLDTGDGPGDRISAAGYAFNSWAENIAAGYQNPSQVMNGWMNSPGHRNNILSTGVREIGVGYYYQGADGGNVRRDSNSDCVGDGSMGGPYSHYWTQNFGRISSAYPVVIDREAFTTSSAEVDLYVYGSGWAEDMRFRNEAGPWSAWEPYASDAAWSLSSGGGVKTVRVELRNGTTVRTGEDQIVLEGSVPVRLLSFSAHRTGQDVAVLWSVADQTNHAGFYLHRAEGPGDRIRLNQELLRGGSEYRFVDTDVPAGDLTYWLAEISRTGETSWLGSVTVSGSVTPTPLFSSFPNPFSAGTRIQYSLPRQEHVRLVIYDLRGSRVATLVDAVEDPGTRSAEWNGRTSTGAEAPAGLYIMRLQTGDVLRTRKIIRSR